MFGGINGIGRFFGLLAQLVHKVLQIRKEHAAQERYDAAERDPAGAFIDRYGVRPDETDKTASPETDPGERNKK
jgi:hypothetical protein